MVRSLLCLLSACVAVVLALTIYGTNTILAVVLTGFAILFVMMTYIHPVRMRYIIYGASGLLLLASGAEALLVGKNTLYDLALVFLAFALIFFLVENEIIRREKKRDEEKMDRVDPDNRIISHEMREGTLVRRQND